MLESLPQFLKERKLQADVRMLLLFHKAIERGLVRTLGDVYNTLKAIVVKSKEQIGPFTKAFYEYFLEIDFLLEEKLNNAVARSAAFKNWKEDYESGRIAEDEESLEELVNKYLDQVHLSSYDIKKIIDGEQTFKNDNPDLEDNNEQEKPNEPGVLDKMADYSKLSIEEILERMKQIEKQQKSKHWGGNHWIGSGGTSPYGHGGAAKGGVRVGGAGGGKMAREVLNDRNYYPVDINKLVNDDNIDAALAALKGVVEESALETININSTIKEGVRRGGLFLPEIENVNHQKLQVILLIDNGGYSMAGYVKTVQSLFKKMKTRFAHDLETFYFHNTIYDRVYTDAARLNPIKIGELLSKDPNYKIFIIGDASMGVYEITNQSLQSYQSLTKKFKKVAWLNPEPMNYWDYTPTIQIIKQLVNMYPLTPKGISDAVIGMNR